MINEEKLKELTERVRAKEGDTVAKEFEQRAREWLKAEQTAELDSGAFMTIMVRIARGVRPDPANIIPSSRLVFG